MLEDPESLPQGSLSLGLSMLSGDSLLKKMNPPPLGAGLPLAHESLRDAC